MPLEEVLPEKIDINVPDDFDLPDLLVHPVPRPLPEKVMRKRHMSQITIQVCMGISAIACILLSRWGLVQYMSLYFLPLAWLDWIGGALLVIQFIMLLCRNLLPPHLQAFRDGIAVPAVINDLVKQPEMIVNGVPSRISYFANISLIMPGHSEANTVNVQSFPLHSPDDYDCTYHVGDWIPALCNPTSGGYNVNIYGFVGVDDNVGVVKRNKSEKVSWKALVKVVLLLPLIPVLFFLLFWNVYAYEHYSPLNVGFADVWPALALGAGLGFAGMTGWLIYSLRQHQRVRKKNAIAAANGKPVENSGNFWTGGGSNRRFMRIIMFFGAPFISALIVYCWAITLNAMLDDSEARVEIVDIDSTVMVTHTMIFRQYVIKYHFPGKKKIRSFHTSYGNLRYFVDRKGAIVAVHKGAFGWPWIKKMAPL